MRISDWSSDVCSSDLLHRTTRRLHPTPEGVALAEQGRELVEDLEALTSGLRRSATEVSGTLRVTTSASFGRLYVSPLLPEFLLAHPRLRVSIRSEEHTSELQSLMRISYAVFCL